MSAPTSTPRPRRLLVIGAHAADFVWRAAGAIAVTTAGGGTASVLALSYGERGESGELWKEPGQTVERVKQIRRDEATRAATVVRRLLEEPMTTNPVFDLDEEERSAEEEHGGRR